MDQRDYQKTGSDHCEPTRYGSRHTSNEIADANNVQANRSRRAAGDHDRFIELSIGKNVAMDH